MVILYTKINYTALNEHIKMKLKYFLRHIIQVPFHLYNTIVLLFTFSCGKKFKVIIKIGIKSTIPQAFKLLFVIF